MSIIEVDNVCFEYDIAGEPTPILKGVSFNVEAGEFVAIQGPSGSGKSTLLYLLGGLQSLTSGDIRIRGISLPALSADEMALFRNAHVGFIFQQFHLLPRTSVLKNILLPSAYPFEFDHPPPDEARAKKLAEQLGLKDRLEHKPNQLSGGQQQRVAIARALMNDAKILFADEPTGNLDSKSSEQTLTLLKELNSQGITIVLITHDRSVAEQAHRIVHVRDGQIEKIETLKKPKSHAAPASEAELPGQLGNKSPGYVRLFRKLLPLCFDNLRRNGIRSLLTMLGVTIGIAAVVAMVTLGQFTKAKILQSYQDMGVNTLMFQGYPNWELRATDTPPVMFHSFNWEKDLVPLRQVFPQIRRLSPYLYSWMIKLSYGGKTIESDARIVGVNQDALSILNREILTGAGISPYHIETKSSVCVIGYDVARRLFANVSPVGRILFVSEDENRFGCRVIGVMNRVLSGREGSKPNLQVIMPYSTFQTLTKSYWQSNIYDVMIQLFPDADVEAFGRAIKAYFKMKYGVSAVFYVDSNSVLLAQMKKFLTLFTIMLAAIALVSLTVGGIGITNMMLVSVSERYREVGLRKALGATNRSIRGQFLLESLLLCGAAGLLGIVFGVLCYEGLIYGASVLVPKLEFAWIFDGGAMVLSVISILAVGLLSGLFPALKAEKLEVVEALRAE